MELVDELWTGAHLTLDRVEEDDGAITYTVEVLEENDEESFRRSGVPGEMITIVDAP